MNPLKIALTIRQSVSLIRHAWGNRITAGGRIATALKTLSDLADKLEKEGS